MNYYERIQTSIDYIEDNLETKINLADVSKIAYMSISVFYRMFFSIVGFTVKEYIRNRRFAEVSHELRTTDKTIIDLAVICDYENADSFARSFQNTTGFLPSEFRKNKENYIFERIDIMDKYFEIQDKELLEKYPEIKVLKQLEPMKVAYYNYYGENPEKEAIAVITKWFTSAEGMNQDKKYRIFGYNSPSPQSPDQKEYGYEVCVTIEDTVSIDNDKMKIKLLEGGFYATFHVKAKDNERGYEIMKGWERVNRWMKDSKYEFGEHQWLEEHLGFDENLDNFSEVELYVPIKKR